MSNILKINLRLYESLDPKLFNYLSSFESGTIRNEIIRRMLSQAIQNPETKLDPIEPVKTDTNQANNTSDEPVSNQKTDQTSLQTDLTPTIQYPESSPSKTHEDKQSKQQNEQNEQNQPSINPSSNSSINQDFADSFVNIL